MKDIVTIRFIFFGHERQNPEMTLSYFLIQTQRKNSNTVSS